MITARKSPWSCTTLPPRRRSPHDRALEKIEKLELSTIKSARRPLRPSANRFLRAANTYRSGGAGAPPPRRGAESKSVKRSVIAVPLRYCRSTGVRCRMISLRHVLILYERR